MCFALDMCKILLFRGGAAYLEHPEYPHWVSDRHPASIWRSDAIKAMDEHEEVSLFSFDQCTQMQIARKPTTLLLLRLPWVAQTLLKQGRRGRCDHPDGHPRLLGKNPDGSFKTAPAKVYTPAFSAVLAQGFMTFCAQLAHRGAEAGDVCPVDFKDFHCSAISAEGTYAPDFHAGT